MKHLVVLDEKEWFFKMIEEAAEQNLQVISVVGDYIEVYLKQEFKCLYNTEKMWSLEFVTTMMFHIRKLMKSDLKISGNFHLILMQRHQHGLVELIL